MLSAPRAPLIALAALVLLAVESHAAPESILPLQQDFSGSTCYDGQGNRWDLKDGAPIDGESITLIRSAAWPWVLVQVDASTPYEIWINFAQVHTVRRRFGILLVGSSSH